MIVRPLARPETAPCRAPRAGMGRTLVQLAWSPRKLMRARPRRQPAASRLSGAPLPHDP